jgi:hypothetical protein
VRRAAGPVEELDPHPITVPRELRRAGAG